VALASFAAERCPFPILTSSGSNNYGVVPSRWRSGRNSLRPRAEDLRVDVVDFGGWVGSDREPSPELPGLFIAICGIAGATCASVPGHGACPQGERIKSAVFHVFDFSICFFGRQAFSDLQ
jgi:hypothetical protein